jgi:hypothetical protein
MSASVLIFILLAKQWTHRNQRPQSICSATQQGNPCHLTRWRMRTGLVALVCHQSDVRNANNPLCRW